MLENLWNLIVTQLQTNNFLSGGAVLMVLGAAMALLRHLPGRIWHWLVHQLFITVEIPIRDQAFFWFDEWLSEHKYGQKRARALTVRTIDRGRADGPPRILLSPAVGIHWLFWRGMFMIVQRVRVDQPQSTASPSNPGLIMEKESFQLSCLTRNRARVTELLLDARSVAIPPDDARVTVYTPMGAYWEVGTRVTPRPLESVILQKGVMEGLVTFVNKFLASKPSYIRRGLPYRTGCLLFGPPGGGKSSTVLALASHLGMDVAVLNLADEMLDDRELQRLVCTLPPKCFLLIEDVDCAFVKRVSTKDKKNGVSFSGLLNAIDGIAAGEGRVLFMNTNHPERLDPALIRPGRADLHVLLDYADADQARQLYLRFFPEEDSLARQFADSLDEGMSMAKLQAHLLAHESDAVAAVERFQLIETQTFEAA